MTNLNELLIPDRAPAILALENGRVFAGYAIGATGTRTAEVVFNTAMTGYQEILTDPSYAGQIVTLTYPHIGNTGINAVDVESAAVQASGLIVRDLPLLHSNWRAEAALSAYLKDHDVMAMAGLDTRALTRQLRQHGALRGCLMCGEVDAEAALAKARALASLDGQDLAIRVTTRERHAWNEGLWDLDAQAFHQRGELPHHVVCYDFGVKHNILRLLHEAGCRLTVVPADTPAADVLALSPDGVFLSNGPGDPAACGYAIEATRELLDAGLPIFGICLGHQILSLACGAQTEKMKFGHHGANHPVLDAASGRVMITSQNHGFAVSENAWPADLQLTHRSLFDGSVQGVRHTTHRASGFQGHPEASPGPHDARVLFAPFLADIEQRKQELNHA